MTTGTDERLVVRLAREEELADVVRLRWLWTGEREGPDAAGAAEDYVPAAAEWARAHQDSHLAHVAVLDGAVVGMAWLALSVRVPKVGAILRLSGDLQSCYVLPEHRRSGIGGVLVRAVLDTAADRGVEHVTVHTSPDSVAMYARNGFAHEERLLYAEPPATGGAVR
ncbi:GNAT family N-acetyltransferase [Antribacter gilvus]|uniref:GNAT family N-acetyltransferase n=1 Tax=Antribacter gilvus TaxID=2304675 RepID=UPI000F7963AA|nr:GNAT family N-acetyltransferase [Antribacter gilvus]